MYSTVELRHSSGTSSSRRRRLLAFVMVERLHWLHLPPTTQEVLAHDPTELSHLVSSMFLGGNAEDAVELFEGKLFRLGKEEEDEDEAV
jgi:hypothetical protein